MKQREHAALGYVAALKKSFTASAADLSLLKQKTVGHQTTYAEARGKPVFLVFYDCGSGANKREEPGLFPVENQS
jgi:hypothetical protein